MAFDLMGKVKAAQESLTDAGTEKALELLNEVNVLLELLQDAGYEVNAMEAELGLPPKVTIHLKTGSAVNEAKLNAISREHPDQKFQIAIVEALIQANRLCDAVNLGTVELKGTEIVFQTPPKITLQWQKKNASA
jgi:hypothetical protein